MIAVLRAVAGTTMMPGFEQCFPCFGGVESSICLEPASASHHTMPDKFTLFFSKNTAAYQAVVKWRRHNQIGAEYSSGAERSLLK